MKKYYHRKDDSLEQLFTAGVLLYIVYLVIQFNTNRGNFWHWLGSSVAVVVSIAAMIFLWRKAKYRLGQRHFNILLNTIRRAGQEDYLKNFINRFGLENTKNGGWSFRGHDFNWDRINDLKKILREKGIVSDENDVFAILRFYIQETEENVTRESIQKKPQKFTRLSGTEFEVLLSRLFQAMGYRTELTGKSGDQGGDLIANKEGERILIQAKCYRDWSTGNSAVQQVVGAMKYYDCNRAMVVTTSYFTTEAMALAKANKTELVSKEKLQELLLKYLGESWF